MTTDFTSIKEIGIYFVEHPTIPKIHTHLNNIYQDAIPNHQRIYTDETAQAEVKPTNDLKGHLLDIIVDEMLAPNAIETANASATIRPLIQSAIMQVTINRAHRRITKDTLTQALTAARTACQTSIEI